MTTFQDFALPEALQHKLDALGFDKPTPVQERAIPAALEHRDILGSAQTGTGKTAAFSIPLLTKIMNHADVYGIIVTPTRELALQVDEQIRAFLSAKSKIRSVVLIGGASIERQVQALGKRPKIVVGTPGRIIDHLERKSLDLSGFNYVVLDETDRMLDMGFSAPIAEIFSHVSKERQTLLFSATLPKNIQKISAQYLQNPVRIEMGQVNSVGDNIVQSTQFVSKDGKFEMLVDALREHDQSAIVFMNSKFATEKMAKRLKSAGITAEAIHGDLRQSKRERVISNLRDNKFRVLVATDVAARGIDVPHIHQVINFDLPRQTEDYIHRIGRTGRNGAQGIALNLATRDDMEKLNDIERLINPNAAKSAHNRPAGKPARKKPQAKGRWRNKKSNRARAA
ncbi:MAG: DEAD/DEAH box helicase [Paracoccaceae bacterium]|jgi:superfamily II DNA/RNA helicase|nr:DEAD/DEAH box helicase [Paracoccaceae bacterium]NDD42071.1 DEAD/DEAH box helicase [Paracoccaceae bacterium]NDD89548.1 DEAD/DEAH box helicase [Paracoccaceae bacterium]NDI04770.1 DEAD/DEAH box helicase [Paracoccaceae bacterium]NDI12881.1 DEAD/DEAH box helicase [Paracoccaceae bacterium]